MLRLHIFPYSQPPITLLQITAQEETVVMSRLAFASFAITSAVSPGLKYQIKCNMD